MVTWMCKHVYVREYPTLASFIHHECKRYFVAEHQDIRMYVCMYACMYVHVCVSVHECVHICMICTHMHTFMYVYVYIHTFICMYIYILMCVYIYMYIFMLKWQFVWLVCTYYKLQKSEGMWVRVCVCILSILLGVSARTRGVCVYLRDLCVFKIPTTRPRTVWSQWILACTFLLATLTVMVTVTITVKSDKGHTYLSLQVHRCCYQALHPDCKCKTLDQLVIAT